ncbi:MAG: hypothetical protein M1820_002817 [Bogoriella megaspora]|nr:MAG: hypothetical protein M1820_002817 [Bogoriella megaspora]
MSLQLPRVFPQEYLDHLLDQAQRNYWCERYRYTDNLFDLGHYHPNRITLPGTGPSGTGASSGASTGASSGKPSDTGLPLTSDLTGISGISSQLPLPSGSGTSLPITSIIPSVTSQPSEGSGSQSGASETGIPDSSSGGLSSVSQTGSSSATVIPIITTGSDGLPSTAASTISPPVSATPVTSGEVGSATLPAPSELTSALSVAQSSIVSALSSGVLTQPTGATGSGLLPAASSAESSVVSSLGASLSSSLASVVATATDQSAASNSVASEISSQLSAASSALHSQVSSALNGGPTGSSTLPVPVSATETTSSGLSTSASSVYTDSSGSTVPIVPLSSGDSTVLSFPSPSASGTETASGTSIPLTSGLTTSLSGSSAPTETSTGSSETGSEASGTTSAPSVSTGSQTSVESTSASGIGTFSSPGSETSGLSTGSSSASFSLSFPIGGTQTMAPPSTNTASVEGSAPAATEPTSLQPTGTDPATTLNAATSIFFQPTPTGSIPPPTDSGIPSSIPRIIQPPGGMPPQPSNSTLVQLGFGYSLNYPFVASTYGSAEQIFQYLPVGISYGLNIQPGDISMHALQPYDTTQDLHYITTLALLYVPSDQVNALSLNLHTPVASIYNHPDPAVKTLMSLISPSFPIAAGEGLGAGGAGNNGNQDNPSGASTSPSDGGSPIGGDTGSSQPVKKSSVGIGVGVCAGAVAYGAAMFIVARRYKRRKSERNLHNRASSLGGGQTYGAMGQTGAGAFMSGARGSGSGNNERWSPYGRNSAGGWGSGGRDSRGSGHSSNGRSVREAGISAPVMAENSLGWN